jgi:hypothetical protein
MTAIAAFLLCLSATVSPGAGSSPPLAHPQGTVILTITGRIGRTNAPGRAELDVAALERLGARTLQTSTPWTDGQPIFKGVLGRDLLDLVEANGRTVRAIALNDYVYDIPISDFENYPVLLAYEMNGRPLKARDKGPIWIVFPLDQFEELRDRLTERKMVWQLTQLRIE